MVSALSAKVILPVVSDLSKTEDVRVAQSLLDRLHSGALAPEIGAGLQTCIGIAFLDARFPSRLLAANFHRRLVPVLGSPPSLPVGGFLNYVKQGRAHTAVCSARFFLNGLATCTRMTLTPIRPCIFGCGGIDSTKHYWTECLPVRAQLHRLGVHESL